MFGSYTFYKKLTSNILHLMYSCDIIYIRGKVII